MKKINVFFLLQLFLQALIIEIKINFFLSSFVNSLIFVKSNLFILFFGSFQKSFGILSLLFWIFFFFLIELSNLKWSKELTKVLSIILKTKFNMGIKPPIVENNSRRFLYLLSKISFFFDRQILKLPIIVSLYSSIVLDESS